MERGMSQADLAKRTGRTQAAVSLWESGKRTLGLDDLLDLSRELQKDLDYFLPPERLRQPIGMLLRATAERIAGSELRDVVDELLVKVEQQGVPPRTIEIAATTPTHAAEELLRKAGIDEAPVPVDQLARDCGMLVLEAEMSDGLSGLVFEVDDGAVIAINSRHAPNSYTTRWGTCTRQGPSWCLRDSIATGAHVFKPRCVACAVPRQAVGDA